MKKVSISQGNQKMGAIPSVSLPPIVTCKNFGECGDLLKWAKIYEKHLAKGDLVGLNINISKVKETI